MEVLQRFEQKYLSESKFAAGLGEFLNLDSSYSRIFGMPQLEITPVNSPQHQGFSTSVEKASINEKDPEYNKHTEASLSNLNGMQLLLKNLPMLDQNFHLHKKIGEGTFSTVYLATMKNVNNDQQYAVKYLTQNYQEARVARELWCLRAIGGCDNVVGLNLFLHNGDDCVTFIMPYLPHKRFSDYVLEMNEKETQLYMKNLLIALRRVHTFGIIHRDVKPGNFLYNRETKEFLLVDFGLAQSVPDNPSSPKLGCKTPEPLDYSNQRKRKMTDDESTPTFPGNRHPPKRLALQPKDGNIPCPVPQASHDNVENRDRDKKSFYDQENKEFSHSRNDLKSPLKVQGSSEKKRTNKSSVEKTPLKTKSYGSTPNYPLNYSRKKLFTNDNNFERMESKNVRKESIENSSDGTYWQVRSVMKKSIEKNRETMWKDRSFTPLVANKSSSGSFVQVRNSRVVKQGLMSPNEINATREDFFQKPSPFIIPSNPVSPVDGCVCKGKAAICSACGLRKRMVAPRAGTPGFRPPEVLFKYPYQTTAVDMWAAGVVLLCILSGCYPFFKSPNDLSALAEVITIFGTEPIANIASKFGRRVVSSSNKRGVNLKKLCKRLRTRAKKKIQKVDEEKSKTSEATAKCPDCLQQINSDGCLCLEDEENYSIGSKVDSDEEFSDSAYHLLSRLLDLDPSTRITASEALNHPFFHNS